jgi:hypothetical protein
LWFVGWLFVLVWGLLGVVVLVVVVVVVLLVLVVVVRSAK